MDRRLQVLFLLTVLSCFSTLLFLPGQASAEPGKASTITCMVDPQAVTFEESVEISIKLTDASTGEGLERRVHLYYSDDDGASWSELEVKKGFGIYTEPIYTDENGEFGPLSWTPPGHLPHDYLLKTSWKGDEEYEPATSQIQRLSVELPPSPEIRVVSSSSYTTDSKLNVVGEFENSGSHNVEDVKIATVYYDSEGVVLDTEFESHYYILTPGQKYPFKITRYQSAADYAVVVAKYYVTEETPVGLGEYRLVDDALGVSDGRSSVSLTVVDNGTRILDDLYVYATFYGGGGRVVDVASTVIGAMVPGQEVNLVLEGEVSSSLVENYGLATRLSRVVERKPCEDVEVVQSRYDPSVTSKLFAEIRNLGESNLDVVAAYALFYDSEGAALDLGYTTTIPIGIMVPGQLSPIGIYHYDPDGEVASYELWVEAVETEKRPYREFQVTSQTVSKTSSEYIVSGSVKNTGEEDATSVDVVATFYDQSGKLVSYGTGYVGILGAGETRSFEVSTTVQPGEIVEAVLQVDCYQYTTPKSTTISLSAAPLTVKVGDTVTVSGLISPSQPHVNVTLTFTLPDNTTITREVVTDIEGVYSHALEVDQLGTWTVVASWPGDEEYGGASSGLLTFQAVDNLPPIADFTHSPTHPTIKDTIQFADTSSDPDGRVVSWHWDFGDGSTSTDSNPTHQYSEKGSYTVKLTVQDQDGARDAVSKTVDVEEKKCIIATTTFGSELAPEVQFLRDFRDGKVLNTYAGSQFMEVFDAWYYSFSTPVAAFIQSHPSLKAATKAALYPLIGILHLSQMTYTILSFAPELAIIAAGLLASSLIGIVYLTPLNVLGVWLTNSHLRKRSKLIFNFTHNCNFDLLRTATISWLVSLLLLVIGEAVASKEVLMFSTSLFVLTTLTTSAMITTKTLTTYLRRVKTMLNQRGVREDVTAQGVW